MTDIMRAARIGRLMLILTHGRTDKGHRHVGLRVVWL